jgi:formamidopyrimidine-DNA glycosylase
MPELPEVETTRRGVEPHCRGREIRRLVVRDARLRWPVPDQLATIVPGQTVEAVERRGKYLLFRLQAGSLLVHLGMSGSLRVVRSGTPHLPHDHIDVQLEGDTVLRYHDPRRFGCFLWIPAGESHPLLQELGPEPLSAGFDGELLYRRSRSRKIPIKNFIMDAKVVVGVGNIYANEALFRAGIRPDRAAGRVSQVRYERLADEIKQVLTYAIGQGGTTLRDFVGGDGRPGYFARQLSVYGRAGAPCTRCGRPLREVRLGQRTSVYCVTCQR